MKPAVVMRDEETAKFIGGVQAPSQVWRSLMSMAGSWTLHGWAMFSVVDKESGRWVSAHSLPSLCVVRVRACMRRDKATCVLCVCDVLLRGEYVWTG